MSIKVNLHIIIHSFCNSNQCMIILWFSKKVGISSIIIKILSLFKQKYQKFITIYKDVKINSDFNISLVTCKIFTKIFCT